jgi:hypothetical protein
MPEPDPRELILMVALAWRGGLIGLVLYLSLSLAERGSGSHAIDLVTFLAATMWAYLDGGFGRYSWRCALAEAVVLFMVAMLALRFLATAFGTAGS